MRKSLIGLMALSLMFSVGGENDHGGGGTPPESDQSQTNTENQEQVSSEGQESQQNQETANPENQEQKQDA